MPHRGRYTERPALQARPVARAAFFATRLSPAPVFRAALFADLMAFVVLDFLRLAFFMIPPVPGFVQLGCSLVSCQAPPVIFGCRAKRPSRLPR
jgi:hypothetical protein